MILPLQDQEEINHLALLIVKETLKPMTPTEIIPVEELMIDQTTEEDPTLQERMITEDLHLTE
jgi:hypothetical protein